METFSSRHGTYRVQQLFGEVEILFRTEVIQSLTHAEWRTRKKSTFAKRHMKYLFYNENFSVFSRLQKNIETSSLYGELYIFFSLCNRNFKPLVTVWRNTPLWEYFVLLWTEREDGGTSKDSCCEHVEPCDLLLSAHFHSVFPFEQCLAFYLAVDDPV